MQLNLTVEAVWSDVQKIRSAAPLVHNITNYVVMNNTANALLALGASPVMAHAREEVEDMVAIASALVINIGTLSSAWVETMASAMSKASAKGIPIIFDPVGAGATAYRTRTCHELMNAVAPTVIRGNASEIMALVDAAVATKGVDSSTTEKPVKALRELARQFSCAVVVSGETDLVSDGETWFRIRNGHALMPRVTGLGCTASALVGAFAAVQPEPLSAAAHAMAVMGICGEIAAAQAAGPGSLQMYFLDALYQLNEERIATTLKGC